MQERFLRRVTVKAGPDRAWRGVLIAAGRALPVALGRSGIRADKREGDGATPRGIFRPVRIWWRADREARPRSALPVRRIRPGDAWCEDPRDRRYNRPVNRAQTATGDRLWREDALYDLILEIDHNLRPRIAGRGSAVFIHVARPNFGPTAGCVALRAPELRRLLARFGPKTRIAIH